MKKLYFFGMLVVSTLLTACSSGTKVSVAKGKDQSVFSKTQVVKQVEIPSDLPTNVTAICRDGSYSTATTYICSGNGGVQTVINHYYSE